MVNEGPDIGDVSEHVALAAAVVRRAFVDLRATQERYAEYYRWDAYDFLTKRLWESTNLWGGLLAHSLVKHMILREVKRICPIPPKKVDKGMKADE